MNVRLWEPKWAVAGSGLFFFAIVSLLLPEPSERWTRVGILAGATPLWLHAWYLAVHHRKQPAPPQEPA